MHINSVVQCVAVYPDGFWFGSQKFVCVIGRRFKRSTPQRPRLELSHTLVYFRFVRCVSTFCLLVGVNIRILIFKVLPAVCVDWVTVTRDTNTHNTSRCPTHCRQLVAQTIGIGKADEIRALASTQLPYVFISNML